MKRGERHSLITPTSGRQPIFLSTSPLRAARSWQDGGVAGRSLLVLMTTHYLLVVVPTPLGRGRCDSSTTRVQPGTAAAISSDASDGGRVGPRVRTIAYILGTRAPMVRVEDWPWSGSKSAAPRRSRHSLDTDSAHPRPPRWLASPMAKAAVNFACTECGYSAGRWFGKCPGCNAFGSLVEETPGRLKPVGRRASRSSASSTSTPRRRSGSRPACPSSTASSAAGSSREPRPRRRRARVSASRRCS